MVLVMPKFSKSSLEKLATCHIDLQTLFNEVIKTFDCIVTEGYRNQEDQEKAFASGNRCALRFHVESEDGHMSPSEFGSKYKPKHFAPHTMRTYGQC